MLKKFLFVITLLGFTFWATAFKTGSLPVACITLQKQPLQITPKEFYVAAVEDGRKDNTAIGALQSYTLAPGKPPEAYPVDIKDGMAAIKNFIITSMTTDKSLRPVIIKLNDLNVSEVIAAPGVVKGEIKLSMAFYLQKGEDPIHLVDYHTTTSYRRKAGPAQQIEPLLRSALNNSLSYLNNWMNAQAPGNIKLARSFKITFKDYNEPAEGDTIYYATNRPLKWDDFKGKMQTDSRHGAEIFAGIGYEEEKKVENATIYLTFAMKVYAPKSACWVSPGTLTPYNLNHEQRHFDIAKLVAEHYKKEILAQNPTPDSYDAIISMGYLDALREMNKMQKLYDNETAHSINSYQQQMWNNRIDKELAELKIKTKAL
ncbi:hypothetical protein [Mucilaginibacter phyllosphaerae]|uniref:DUF922 domain-containing protein n=1 Tax=Mucilaginibacter phyllosphaerae TaxID=1812349 RepID=A0A4Y8AGQ6_9SPHI|nr:hypothetical protein [Mucilaginibacter phyllosphaerae]MBB3968426.1 hypothetical protein [Mucilaginibacter phyllosphaerae]TEW67926.1 hypothetical protein E2R65_08035 [Mucilaginibacter phyllosphaerae]GGH16078.1 hypothetical protein GCM10007352_25240 [Mucilaginibacter phyllosphaerae]